MLFHYTAFDQRNMLVEGDADLQSVDAVLDYLSHNGLKPIKITPIDFGTKKIFGLFYETISLKDQLFLFKYLSLMLKVGTDLIQALNVLMEDFAPGPAKRFLLEARTNLEKGNPFYVAFEKHPETFSLVTISLIKSGEKAGNLEEVLTKLSESLEKNHDLQSKIKSSLAYPVVLIIVSISLVFFLMTFLFPKLTTAFSQSGVQIPKYTQVLINMSQFFNTYQKIIIPLLIIVPTALVLYFWKTKRGQKQFESLLRKIPPIRNFMNMMALQRLASTLGSLIRSGMPLLEAIKITADTVGSTEYQAALLNINKNIGRGMTVGEAFKQEKIFPAVLSNLLSIGEKAGHISEILTTLSEFYEKEIEAQLKTLVSLIEPLIIVFMGLVIGGIAVSVIMPMYQVIGGFGGEGEGMEGMEF